MAGTSSSVVAGLVAAAVGTVGVLAWQASAHAPAGLGGKPHPGPGASSAAAKAPRDRRHPTALPAGSGAGERVVYSVDDDRVWLVSAHNRVQRTFKVRPGTVDPAPGSYAVMSRSNLITGTDGVPVEHVVRFAMVGEVVIGFSAATGGQTPDTDADPTVRTGGVRESRADGTAMWNFATIGVPVVVIR